MTEITTSVLFLVASLYGSGQTNIAQITTDTTEQATIEKLEDTEVFTTRDPAVMEKYLRQVYAGDPVLIDIARCESNFRQFDKNGQVVRGKVDRNDIGVMQINERYHVDTAKKLGLDIHSTPGNIAYAKYLYDKEGTKPWSASQKCWSVGNALAKK